VGCDKRSAVAPAFAETGATALRLSHPTPITPLIDATELVMMVRLIALFSFILLGIYMVTPSASADPAATDRARKFIEAHTAKVRPLEIAANRAWWDANISGKKEDFAKKQEAQNKLDALLSDKAAFAEVKAIKEAGGIDDPITKRAIDIVYLAYLEKQLDEQLLKKMTALANAVEEKFNNFRAEVDGKKLTDAEVRKV